MNGHSIGERAGWLVAAALVVVGTSTTGMGDRPSSTGAPARAGAIGAAVSDVAALVDPLLGEDAQSAPTSGMTGPDRALAADGFLWPNPRPAVVTTVLPAPKPAAPKPAAPKPAAPAIWWSVYHGTNHVWMPTLGINRPVYSFPCSRGTSPDNLVYRWGCAGANNVYLLGHAYGVFKALHDAYYNGRLKVGMPVIYADSRGRVHLFRVTTWRVVSPADASWAIAAQSRLSMTLQTCIGATGTERLNVRLVAVSR